MVNGRLVGAGLTVLALGLGFVVGTGNAADADVKGAATKIANLLEKKDSAGAKKEAAAVAPNAEIEDVMHLMSLRRSKGLGVGAKPGAITPDGIEAKIMELGKRPMPAAKLTAEAADLTRMAYVTAAIGELAHAKPPQKDEGKKKKKDWETWSADMRDAALKLADITKAAKSPADVKTAATKLYSTCTTCHEVFRE